MRFKFTIVAKSRNWDWRQIHLFPRLHPIQQFVEPGKLGSWAEPQPPAILVHFRTKRKLLVRFKFTIVAKSRNWDWRQIQIPLIYILSKSVLNVVTSASGVQGGAPAASDFGASSGKKRKVLISTTPLCGGVARKFSLVKIPILRHCFFRFFFMVKKYFWPNGG